MNTPQRIELYLKGNTWIARFVNDPQMIELFGTDAIPTPFTASAEPWDVFETIKHGNPLSEVILRPPPPPMP